MSREPSLPIFWSFLQSKVTPVVVFVYQILALLVFAAIPVLAYSWLRTPFIGALIEQTMIVTTVSPTHAGSWELRKAGLPYGYQLQSIAGQPVRNAAEMQHVLGQYSPGDRVAVAVRAPMGETLTYEINLQRFPSADRLTFLYLPYFIGLIYLISGLWVFSLRRADAAGRAFGLFTASVAIAVAGLFEISTTQRLTYLWTLAIAMAGGAMLDLAFLFPIEVRLAVRFPYLRWLGYALAIILALNALPSLFDFEHPTAYALAWRWEYIFVGLSAILFLSGTLVRRYTSPSPIAREQARLILWGSLIAFGPITIWFFATALRQAFAFSAYLLLPLAVFPLVTSYAIQRYRLLQTDYVLSRATLYALLTVMAVTGYTLFVSGLSLILGRNLPANNPFLIGLLVFILAFLFDPLRQRLQRFVNSIFFRGQAAYRQRLQAFSSDLTQITELPAIIQLLRQYCQQTLSPIQTHVFVHDTLSGQYVATADESGQPTSDLYFAPDSPLALTLEHRHVSVFLADERSLPIALQPERARLTLLGAQLFIPLPGQRQLTGWLALGPRHSGEPYGRDDLAFLESLSDQAALAIERAQVITDLERRVQEMNILTRVAEGINITLVFNDLLEMFYAQTNYLIPSRDFRITLVNQTTQDLYHAFYLEDDERIRERENLPLPKGQGLEAEVMRTQHAIVTDHYERECRQRGLLPNAAHIYAWMGVPLNAGARTIGAFSLGSRDPAVVYTPEQTNLFSAIADLAAGAIVKARLLQETERRAHQMAILNDVSRSLSSTLELDPLLNQIMQSAIDILGCEAGSLLLVDENTGDSVFKVALGPVGADLIGQHVPSGAGLVGRAVKTGQPIIQNDARRSTDWFDTDRRTGFATQDLLVVPMQVKERVIGVLEVLNKHDRSAFTPEDQELLMTFASQAAVAVENARLYTLTDQALADRVEELSVMQRIDRELNASLDVERAMRITLEWAIHHSKADAGLVGLVDEKGVRVLAAQGYPDDSPLFADDHTLMELPTLRETLRTGHLSSAEASSLLPDARTQVVVPIEREDRVIAALLLDSTSPTAFSTEALNFLSRLSDHAAMAVANAQLYEAVQAANQAKSVFVSAAAHELKNPLTSIKGYSDLLMRGMIGPVSEGQKDFLTTIRSNADRMSTLISDLQDISRIEAGLLRLDFKAVSLPEAVEEVARSLSRQIEEKEQTLDVSLPEGLPALWCDQDRLIQILVNLVSNAHKYTPSGGRIYVRAESAANVSEGEAQAVHISVQDEGIGISPQDQPKIFRQFFRSEDPKVREVTGTGLGLNITKNLVEMQGGRIWFESVHQQGTTFHFTVLSAQAIRPIK